MLLIMAQQNYAHCLCDIGHQTWVWRPRYLTFENGDDTSVTTHCEITSKLEENGLKLDMSSAYGGDSVSVNYGKW